MKVKRLGMKEILKRIWLISADKIKASESVCKQLSQLKLNSTHHIIVTDNCSIRLTLLLGSLRIFLRNMYGWRSSA